MHLHTMHIDQGGIVRSTCKGRVAVGHPVQLQRNLDRQRRRVPSVSCRDGHRISFRRGCSPCWDQAVRRNSCAAPERNLDSTLKDRVRKGNSSSRTGWRGGTGAALAPGPDSLKEIRARCRYRVPPPTRTWPSDGAGQEWRMHGLRPHPIEKAPRGTAEPMIVPSSVRILDLRPPVPRSHALRQGRLCPLFSGEGCSPRLPGREGRELGARSALGDLR